MYAGNGVIGRPWRGVVAGFDGTDRGRCAVRWAAEQAARQLCPLYVVRVVEPPIVTGYGWMQVACCYADTDERVHAEDQLAREVDACRRGFPDLEVRAVLQDGRPCARLAEYAGYVDAELIAVGYGARGIASRTLFGSTVEELVRTAGRPVVAVRDTTPVQQASMLTGQSPVVVGVEDARMNVAVLGFAFDVAAHNAAALSVVRPERDRSPRTPVAVGGRVATAAGIDLGPWCDRYPDVPTTVVADERPAQALLERSEQARLLVVGDRRQGALRRLLDGSISRTVLRHAYCSVAIV